MRTNIDTFLGRMVECESIPRDTIFLVPPVSWVKTIDPAGNIIDEKLEFDAKRAAMITGLRTAAPDRAAGSGENTEEER